MTVAIKTTTRDASLYRVRYGDETIVFERLPRDSDTRKILIKVHPDRRVQVRAPVSANDAAVVHAVRKRARWISSRLREFSDGNTAQPKRYISGESHLYLGKRYLLKVWQTHRNLEEVKLHRGRFDVHTSSKYAPHVRRMLETWYRARAVDVFHQRLEAIAEQALWLNEMPELSIRSMTKQWGSCSPGGRLTLNLHLIKAPRDCIDYVILHELCHVAEHNHSKRFYRLMTQVMPRWNAIKRTLDSNSAVYLST